MCVVAGTLITCVGAGTLITLAWSSLGEVVLESPEQVRWQFAAHHAQFSRVHQVQGVQTKCCGSATDSFLAVQNLLGGHPEFVIDITRDKATSG